MKKDKDLFSSESSEDGDIIFRNVNGNPHTPIDTRTGEVLVGKSNKASDMVKDKQYDSKKKMTPDEKIASVHIDFDKDNILPELDDDILKKMGLSESKQVLLKGATIKRNLQRHIDVSDEIMQEVVTEALYRPIDVFPANPNNPNYYHLAAFIDIETENGLKMGLVLLDVDATKKYLEIGHAYFVRSDGYERAKNKTKKIDVEGRAIPHRADKRCGSRALSAVHINLLTILYTTVESMSILFLNNFNWRKIMFARLNALGEEVGAPTDKPTSRLGQNNQRQVGVLYGHNGSGKVYNYLAGSGVRAGDIVTPSVTHPKSGKTYKTLARVVYTRDSMGGAAGDTAGELSNRGILLKNVGRTDQQSLPGFQARKNADKSFTAKQWEQEAAAKQQQWTMQRLNSMGEVPQNTAR